MPFSKTKNLGTILIVEDNIFMAELLAEKITNAGYEAITVYGGRDALDKISSAKPILVLLDLPLPGDMDGFELLTEIRKSLDKTKLPVVVMFNLSQPEAINKSLELGANYYIIKALSNTEDIVAKVEAVLKSKTKEVPIEKIEVSPKGTSIKEIAQKVEAVRKEKVEVSLEVPRKIKAKIDEMLSMPENEISIISLVDSMMEYAFLARASDIHLEPVEDKLIARLRIDGILHDVFMFPKGIHPGVITRIKVLGGMRTDEHQAAQDGRFRITIASPSSQFDVRVSIIPTYYGENAVLRLLAEQTQIAKIDDLALTEENKEKIRRATQRPHGMILATGPTGSGKTTTLYTILKEVNTREVSVITIEDPIEYSLEGIDQIQVNQRTGLTFASGLRSILRQDPNVIMVGEIRDQETASIAVNAALTGHKLLTTIHTNDSATTLPRLLDMGIEPFLVASTVNVAIGQRLVRMICPHCKTKKRLTEAEFDSLKNHLPAEIVDDHRDFSYGKGCAECGDTGYFSRMGLYEVLEINDFIREAIMRRADAGEIKKIAIKNGMVTLLEDGFRKAIEGLTTVEEILRVVNE
ncbi:MAG: Flp pilus assembly complex ATPase component TadA [Candidatus Yanofskybacteria bacterium]|nr:Flp pilus assembly complex ATPase component TadA [Candidatus Yanofskybacteria bacterium]